MKEGGKFVCIEKHFRLNSSAVYVVDKYIFVSPFEKSGRPIYCRGQWAPA
jgi:hypothetical protein